MSDQVSFSKNLDSDVGNLRAYGSMFFDDEPVLQAKANFRIDLNATSGGHEFAVDLQAHVATAPCDLLRMEMGVSGTISLPLLTTGDECGYSETCQDCDGDHLKDVGPYVNCENRKFPVDMKFHAPLLKKDVDFGTLQVKLCDLIGDAYPEVKEFCEYTGSNIIVRTDPSRVVATYTGIQLPLIVEVRLFDPAKAPKLPSAVQSFAGDALEDAGFQHGYIMKQNYNVVQLVDSVIQDPPTWLRNDVVTIGKISGKCDNKTEPFGVQIDLAESVTEANKDKFAADLASIITKQGSLKFKVKAYQLSGLKVRTSSCSRASLDEATAGKTWLCGTMHSGAGKAAGALNTLLSYAVKSGATINVGGQTAKLTKVSSSTVYTCPKVAKDNGGCVASNPPSSGGGGGVATGGDSGHDGDSGLSAGAVVGIVLGCLAGVAAIVFLVSRVYPGGRRWLPNPMQGRGADKA